MSGHAWAMGWRVLLGVILLSMGAAGCGSDAETELIASCTGRNEREAVCACAAERVEASLESRTLERYVHVVRVARRLSEQQDLAGRMERLDRSDLDEVYALQERMKASFVAGGREIGLDRAEVFELLDRVERELAGAIEACRS